MEVKETFVVRPWSLCCVAWLALFCGTALGTHASWAQEAGDFRSTLDDAADQMALADDQTLPPPPPPIFNSVVDERPRAKPKALVTDPYAPIGIKAGAFTLLPSLEIG